MGTTRDDGSQQSMWVATADLPQGGGHPFYERLNQILSRSGFDAFVENLCAGFYARMGRPSLAPGRYFRLLLVGYFEGLDSERAIAWRTADSLSLRSFLRLTPLASPPDHSTISRTRRLLSLETHEAVFTWVLQQLADAGLVRGKTVGVDAKTLEANAALRSIVRRDTGEDYTAFLDAAGRSVGHRDTDSRRTGTLRQVPQEEEEDVERRLDPSPRSGCAGHEDEGRSDSPGPQGRARRGHGDGRGGGRHGAGRRHGRHDVDGRDVDRGGRAGRGGSAGRTRHHRSGGRQGLLQQPDNDRPEGAGPAQLHLGAGPGPAVLEGPAEGPRCGVWQPATDSRLAGPSATALSGRTTGATLRARVRDRRERRVHLRGHPNILKRLLVQVAGCNLGLLLRQLMGVGTPRNLQGRAAVVFSALSLETHEAVFTLRAAGSAAPMPSATLNSRYSRATPHASAPRIHPCSFDPMACLLRHQRGEDGDHVGAADLVRCRSRIEPQYRSRARRRSSGPWPFEAAAASTRSHAVRKVGTRDG